MLRTIVAREGDETCNYDGREYRIGDEYWRDKESYNTACICMRQSPDSSKVKEGVARYI